MAIDNEILKTIVEVLKKKSTIGKVETAKEVILIIDTISKCKICEVVGVSRSSIYWDKK
jgi:hypothetical protein